MNVETSTAIATWGTVVVAIPGAIVAVVTARRARAQAAEATRIAERSAEAAEKSARSATAVEAIEAARRHDELRPRFRPSLARMGTNGNLPALVVDCEGPVTYQTVDVAIETPQGERSVIAGYSQQSQWTLSQMKPGDRASQLVYAPDKYGGRVVVR